MWMGKQNLPDWGKFSSKTRESQLESPTSVGDHRKTWFPSVQTSPPRAHPAGTGTPRAVCSQILACCVCVCSVVRSSLWPLDLFPEIIPNFFASWYTLFWGYLFPLTQYSLGSVHLSFWDPRMDTIGLENRTKAMFYITWCPPQHFVKLVFFKYVDKSIFWAVCTCLELFTGLCCPSSEGVELGKRS